MGAISGSREPSPDGLGPSGFDPGRELGIILADPRWAVVGRFQDFGAIGAILRDRRDWLEREIKRLTPVVSQTQADVDALDRVLAMVRS
jgi:hypothetical protein